MTQQFGSPGAFVRDALRAHTKEVHERLHDHSSFVALFEGTLDLGGYCDLIRRLHGFYQPLDRAIKAQVSRAPGDLGRFSYASVSDLLRADLEDLAAHDQQADLGPFCAETAGLVTPETIGGVLYVVEGSTLGGSLIDRAAQRLLPSEQPLGRRYWAWCRAEGKTRWPMTVRLLGQLHTHGVSIETMAKGAEDTFRTFADWIAPLENSFKGPT